MTLRRSTPSTPQDASSPELIAQAHQPDSRPGSAASVADSSRPSMASWIGLLALWAVGIVLALGSKAYDPDDDEEVAPVEVNFVVTSNGNVVVENGSTVDTVSAATLMGTFEKGGNDAITLRNVPVTFDTNTRLTLSVAPNEGDNLLTGSVEVSVSQALEFGVERLPASGELSLLRDGTTTLITFDGDADNVIVAVGSETPLTLSFDDLRTLFSDQDRELDERFASKAYRTLETLWLVSRISETVQEDINTNLELIESMGFSSPLTLTCDNEGETPAPSYSVAWTVDPAGAGIDEPGSGDTFEMSWFNCFDNDNDRYYQSGARLANYQRDNDTLPRTRSYSFVMSDTLVATETIDSGVPTLVRSRIDGTMEVSATEGDTIETTGGTATATN